MKMTEDYGPAQFLHSPMRNERLEVGKGHRKRVKLKAIGQHHAQRLGD